ncbi:hypothetical protein ACOMHN_054013 [Nucella lapillus]
MKGKLLTFLLSLAVAYVAYLHMQILELKVEVKRIALNDHMLKEELRKFERQMGAGGGLLIYFLSPSVLLLPCLSVAVAYLGYLQHLRFEHAVEAMEERVSSLATTWKANVVETDQFHALQKSVEAAVYQNKLQALEIKSLTDTASEMPSLKRTLSALDVSGQKMSWRLQQEIQTIAGALNAQKEEVQALKKPVNDALRQSQHLVLEVAALKDRTSDLASLKRTLSSLEVDTRTSKGRMDNVESRAWTMEQNLDKVVQKNDQFQEQIQKFKYQVDEYQRSLNDRDPWWDFFTSILNIFDDPFGNKKRLKKQLN